MPRGKLTDRANAAPTQLGSHPYEPMVDGRRRVSHAPPWQRLAHGTSCSR